MKNYLFHLYTNLTDTKEEELQVRLNLSISNIENIAPFNVYLPVFQIYNIIEDIDKIHAKKEADNLDSE
jgi:hypothetical protein